MTFWQHPPARTDPRTPRGAPTAFSARAAGVHKGTVQPAITTCQSIKASSAQLGGSNDAPDKQARVWADPYPPGVCAAQSKMPPSGQGTAGGCTRANQGTTIQGGRTDGQRCSSEFLTSNGHLAFYSMQVWPRIPNSQGVVYRSNGNLLPKRIIFTQYIPIRVELHRAAVTKWVPCPLQGLFSLELGNPCHPLEPSLKII